MDLDRERIRTLVRPMLLFMLTLGSIAIIMEGITGNGAEWWLWIWKAGCIEYLLERPVLKALKKA